MVKRTVSAVLVLIVLLSMSAALAAGTQSDPLISKLYAEDAYRSSLGSFIRETIAGQEPALSARINTLSDLGGFEFADGAVKKASAANTVVILLPGSSYTLTSGSASVSFPSGKVINVSTGTAAATNAALTANQRYFCGENTTATIKFTAASEGFADGYYKTASAAPPPAANMLDGWVTVNGQKYYYRNGFAQKGWLTLGDKKYYLNPDGSMATGWIIPKDKWYYLDKNGVMLTGWQVVGTSWYYLKSDGALEYGWISYEGKWYFTDFPSGAMAYNWRYINGIWYYFDFPSGAMATGWRYVGGKWYYMKSSGAMAINERLSINGKTYIFNASGACTNP